MPYQLTTDFKYGMDRRRMQAVGVPGTLWQLQNGLISRGGDIVRAKKFVKVATLPEGTFAVGSVRGQKFVFGSDDLADSMPAGTQYQRLEHPSGAAMSAILDIDVFLLKFYVIAEFEDGSIYHYYDGEIIEAWSTVADSAFELSLVAEALATRINDSPDVSAQAFGTTLTISARTVGTSFTFSASAIDGGGNDTSPEPGAVATLLQENVEESAVARASAQITLSDGGGSADAITALSVDGVSLISEAVSYVNSLSGTANALAVAINEGNATHGYWADATDAEVELLAPVADGAAANDREISIETDGLLSAAATVFSGGTDAAEAQQQIISVEISGADDTNDDDYGDPTDTWQVTINDTVYRTTGRAAAMGTSSLVYKSRVYCTAGPLWRWCAIADVTTWEPSSDAEASGAGFIDMSSQASDAQRLVCATTYYDQVAIFARSAVLLYAISTDATDNTHAQTLENTGTVAAHSVVSYGANDVFYLDYTGVRSLRARSTTGAAYADDVGNSIDTYLQELRTELSITEVARSQAVIEPDDSRFFLKYGDRIIALSFFPSSSISAWSYLDPGIAVDWIHRAERAVYVRSGDAIYQYGGPTGTEYPDDDELPVIIETPFMSGQDPDTKKQLSRFAFAAEGEWQAELLVDPNDTTKVVDMGTLSGVTFNDLDDCVPAKTALFAFRFTCTKGGYAALAATALHTEKAE